MLGSVELHGAKKRGKKSVMGVCGLGSAAKGFVGLGRKTTRKGKRKGEMKVFGEEGNNDWANTEVHFQILQTKKKLYTPNSLRSETRNMSN